MKKLFFYVGVIGFLTAMLAGCSSANGHKFHGTDFPAVIENMDVASQTLTVAELKSSKLTELTWNKDSRFWEKGTPIEPRQLQRGDFVRIHYRVTDGKMWLQHLYLNTNRTIH